MKASRELRPVKCFIKSYSKQKRGYDICGQCCHVGGWQRKRNLICILLLFSVTGNVLRTERPRGEVYPRWKENRKRHFSVSLWISKNLTRQITFQSIRRLPVELSLRHCLNDKPLETVLITIFFKRVSKFTSTHHSHWIYYQSQNQKWNIAPQKAVVTRRLKNVSVPAILCPSRFFILAIQINNTNIGWFSSGMCFLEQTPPKSFNFLIKMIKCQSDNNECLSMTLICNISIFIHFYFILK